MANHSLRAGLLAVAAFLLISCGSDSKNNGGILAPGAPASSPAAPSSSAGASGSQLFDVQQADKLAHAAMLRTNELPGTGWSTEDDKFDDDSYANVKGCEDVAKVDKDLRVLSVARAKRDVYRTTGESSGMQVSLEVSIYSDSARAADLIGRTKQVSNAAGFAACLESALKSKQTASSRATMKLMDAISKAPASGISFAGDFTVTSGTKTLSVHEEDYTWLAGNAILDVEFDGPKENITLDLVNSVLDKFQAAATDAAKGKR